MVSSFSLNVDQKKSPLDANTPELLRRVDLAFPSALVFQAGDTIHLQATPRVVLSSSYPLPSIHTWTVMLRGTLLPLQDKR